MILGRAFRYASLSAISGSKPVMIDFGKNEARVLEREWPYPQDIESERPVKVTVNASGFARPREILFYKGKEKIQVKIGLFGVTVI